jgi:hypothetical protein
MPLEGGSWVKRAARTVADNFGTYILSGKRVKLVRLSLLFGNMTGLKRIRKTTILRIEQTASKKKQRQNERKMTNHDFSPSKTG